MTTTLTLSLSAVKLGQGHPTTAFGQQAAMPLDATSTNNAAMLSRAALGPEIPSTAVITSATLVYTQSEVISGSYNFKAQRNAAAFSSKTTWNTKPALVGTIVTVTKTSPVAGTLWSLDVTADVQGWVAGTTTNYGWRLTTTTTSRHYWRGATAATGKPTLVVVYEAPTDAPTQLSPAGGSVSVAKPTLTWIRQDGITAAQVQIDPASNGASPAFDSGEVSTVASLLDLTATAYAGLAAAATTSWRVRTRTPAGLSPWSEWATFTRTSKGVLTFTSPGATTADGTPVVQLSFTGTLTAAQIILRDAAGKVLANSGRQQATGSTFSWTPPTGLVTNGQVGSLTGFAVDNVVRVATPGDPIEAIAGLTFTLALTSSVPGMDSVDAYQTGVSPEVYLTGVRASGIPDEVVIFRNGIQIDRMPGADVFAGTAFNYVDYTAPPNLFAEYVVAPFTTGTGVSNTTLVTTITPTCQGLWVMDPESGLTAPMWDTEGDAPAGGDLAVVHQPATGDAPAVRRRLSRPPLSGHLSGGLYDINIAGADYPADDALAAFAAFAVLDQGHIFRMVVGHVNIPVIIGDVVTWPTPLSSASERVATVGLNWWSQDRATTGA